MALNIFCLTAVLWLYGHMVWTGVFKETWAGKKHLVKLIIGKPTVIRKPDFINGMEDK